MNLKEIDMVLDSLNRGREYIEEALQNEEEVFKGHMHLSRCHLIKNDLLSTDLTIGWLKSRREKLEQGSI